MTKAPRLGSAVLVRKGNSFLLGKRNKVNAKDMWIIPGGGIDFGEHSKDAALREIKEETNLDVNITKLLCVQEIIATHVDYHSVVFFYEGEAIDLNQLQPSDDVSEVKFFTIDEIKQLNTVQSVQNVLKDAGYWK